MLRRLFKKAGITINGPGPADIQVYNDNFFRRVLVGGSLGLGESYMDGWWDCERVDLLFEKIFRSGLHHYAMLMPGHLAQMIRDRMEDRGAMSNSRAVGKAHYDLGNELFVAMLGPSMAYTCGYWPYATTLDEAQFAKLRLVCRKLGLHPGDRVLDIGCGFGSFARVAAEQYNASVTGITVSVKQAEWGNAWCYGLPVKLRVKDYREVVTSTFDHLVSLGMFEHVEPRHHAEYFQRAARSLRPGGLFVLHTIGNPGRISGADPWVRRYIFPTGRIPVEAEIEKSIRGVLEVRDWHEFDLTDYDRTLMAWNKNFQDAWPGLSANYGEEFKRMWQYYLLSCAAAFRVGKLRLWQIVLSHPGEHANYQPVR